MVSATVALVAPATVARVAAHRGGSRRVAARLGASAPTRSRRVAVPRAASTDTETASRADASASDEFDDALAEQFKQMYATPGKRIKWGVFKEDVGAVATSPEKQEALRDAAASSLTNIDADERERRALVGKVTGAFCVALAVAQISTGAPPGARAVMALPLFFALGFTGSAETGL